MTYENGSTSDKVINIQQYSASRRPSTSNSYQDQFDRNALKIRNGRPYRFLLRLTFPQSVKLDDAVARMSTFVSDLHEAIFSMDGSPDRTAIRGAAVIDIRHMDQGKYEVWLGLKDYPELPRDDEEATEEIASIVFDRYTCGLCNGPLDAEAPQLISIIHTGDRDKLVVQKLTSDGGAENCVFQVRLNGLE